MVPVPALNPAASLTDVQWPSLSLTSCLERKLQSILPGALGRLVELECLWLTTLIQMFLDDGFPHWFYVRSVTRFQAWDGKQCFPVGIFFLPFTQPYDVLLVSKQIFFPLLFSSVLFMGWHSLSFQKLNGSTLVEIPWKQRCEVVDLRPYLDFIRRFWVGVWTEVVLTSLLELWLQEGWQEVVRKPVLYVGHRVDQEEHVFLPMSLKIK